MTKGLYRILPTLSPDFSGVCSTLFELGGILVIHDAGGCTGTYTGYDEPRWFEKRSRIFTSNLDDSEAVFGDDDILINKLLEADRWLDASFFAIMGSPSPAVLGTDYHALGRLLTEKTGKKVLAFSTTGMQRYDWGVSAALLEIAKVFLPQKREDVFKGTVNLIGATPLDFTTAANLHPIKKILLDAGYSVRSTWTMDCSIDDIKNSLTASHNIALTASAIPVCNYMKKMYDMPYILGGFSGIKPVERFLNSLAGNKDVTTTPVKSNGLTALVVGEQVISNSIRNMLIEDCGFSDVTVCTFFSARPELQQAGDKANCSEWDIQALIRSGGYSLVVGDILLKDLADQGCSCKFVEVPHAAVSSRLGWLINNPPFAEDFLNHVKTII